MACPPPSGPSSSYTGGELKLPRWRLLERGAAFGAVDSCTLTPMPLSSPRCSWVDHEDCEAFHHSVSCGLISGDGAGGGGGQQRRAGAACILSGSAQRVPSHTSILVRSCRHLGHPGRHPGAGGRGGAHVHGLVEGAPPQGMIDAPRDRCRYFIHFFLAPNWKPALAPSPEMSKPIGLLQQMPSVSN